jgi:hypothetical protein
MNRLAFLTAVNDAVDSCNENTQPIFVTEARNSQALMTIGNEAAYSTGRRDLPRMIDP